MLSGLNCQRISYSGELCGSGNAPSVSMKRLILSIFNDAFFQLRFLFTVKLNEVILFCSKIERTGEDRGLLLRLISRCSRGGNKDKTIISLLKREYKALLRYCPAIKHHCSHNSNI